MSATPPTVESFTKRASVMYTRGLLAAIQARDPSLMSKVPAVAESYQKQASTIVGGLVSVSNVLTDAVNKIRTDKKAAA